MPDTIINNETQLVLAQNDEQWRKISFLLKNPEPSIFWFNTDTAFIRQPLREAIEQEFPHFKPYEIHIDEHTVSLTQIILWQEKDKIPPDALIHVYGMEDAVKSMKFLTDLNFHRDSLFRKTPVNLIFWADFATSNVVSNTCYDFWSWVGFPFEFVTPEELLTARQKEFTGKLQLQDKDIITPSKDVSERLRHLENVWQEFLKSVGGKPTTNKQVMDAVTIARALATEYRDEGQHRKAVDILEFTLQLKNEFPDEFVIAVAQNDLAISHLWLGNFETASELFQNCLTIIQEKIGRENPMTATILSSLGSAYRALGNLDEAKISLESALDMHEKLLGINHPNVGRDQSNLAMIFYDLGEFTNSKQLWELALENSVRNFGLNSPEVSAVQSNLATAYHMLGEFKKAKELLEQALNCDLENFGPNHIYVAIRYNNLACVLYDMNDLEHAQEYMQKAYKIRKAEFGAKHSDTIKSLESLNKMKS